jgi:hypothetical protein
MRQDLDALVVAKSGGIRVGMSSIFATIQSARACCRSPVRIVQFLESLPAGGTGGSALKFGISGNLYEKPYEFV